MARDRVQQYVDSDGSYVMELADARAADAGDYTVTASNEFGGCTASSTLVVRTTATSSRPSAPLQDM